MKHILAVFSLFVFSWQSVAEHHETKAMAKPGSGITVNEFLTIKTNFQFRPEFRNATDGGLQSQVDELTGFRVRPKFIFTPHEKLEVSVTPQAAKGYGVNDSSLAFASDGTTVEQQSTSTSGSTNETAVLMHEAYANYKYSPNFHLKLGRQELAYGDQLLIGSLGWNNISRSFDAMKATAIYSIGKADFISARVNNNLTNIQDDDVTLRGIYNMLRFESINLDAEQYYLVQKNAEDDRNTAGVRFKHKWKGLTSILETNTQSGTDGADPDDATQRADIEDASVTHIDIDYSTSKFIVGIDYLRAGKGYNHLYPTAHKFLGIADIVGQRNMNATAVNVGAKFGKFNFQVVYHTFARVSTEDPAYSLGLSAYGDGTNSSDAAIGTETDILINYMVDEHSKIQFGYGTFTPGDYMKAVFNDDDKAANFTYLMFISNI